MDARSQEWTEWLDRHGPALVLYARQWSRSPSDADDIVQEAFVRFWPKRANAAEPVAYLYACVRNSAMDHLSARKRRETRELFETDQTDPVGGSQMLETDMEQQETQQAVEKAMSTLPLEQREVLVMKIWGDLSFREIGKTLDIPLSTAASRYRYALDALRQLLPESSLL